MSIPIANTSELTEKMQFRVTEHIKKAVGHIAVDANSNEQNVANYLLQLGIDAHQQEYLANEPDPQRKRA